MDSSTSVFPHYRIAQWACCSCVLVGCASGSTLTESSDPTNTPSTPDVVLPPFEPTCTDSGEPIAQLALGGTVSYALMDSGLVRCWGSCSLASVSVAANVLPQIEGVKQLAAGIRHVCALLGDGTVRCWGSNSDGKLGDGTVTSTLIPVDPGLKNVVEVAAGEVHSCALLADGAVWCWGDKIGISVQNDPASKYELVPIQIAGLRGVSHLSLGKYHACAILADDVIKCWGQVPGSGPTAVPVTLQAAGPIREFSAGHSSDCAVLADSGLRCWPEGAYSPVALAEGDAFQNLRSVQLGRWGYGCVLLESGAVQCGGSYKDGYADPTVPVVGLGTAPQIAVGGNHACALEKRTCVRCWGRNNYGQLGDGTTTTSSVPRAVDWSSIE